MSDTTLSAQTRFWGAVFAVFAILVWALKPMLLPFVAGLALAYFLDPVVSYLSGFKIPRWLGTMLAMLGFLTLGLFLLTLLIPLLQGQIAALLRAMPGYAESFRSTLLPKLESMVGDISPQDMDRFREAAGQYAGDAVVWAGRILRKLVDGSFAIFDVLALMIITPVVAFYMLRDWPKLTEAVDRLLPRRHRDTIKQELGEVNRALSGFVRGQAMVCLALGFIYSAGLTAAGLHYGATVGIIAGALSFVPYVGSTFGLVAGLGLALLQFDEAWRIGVVLGVFLVGQILEGYVLTPKLVGDRVGLHPVWILFALFAGGSLLGFVGVLIAVPVAAVMGVLVRFALRKYRSSSVYHGDKK